jgi:hypothetical protein
MAVQYIISPESDFSSGIDARSAENQIEPSFVRDLLNADVIEKRVRKRPGYQGFSGGIPVRVTAVEYVNGTDQVCFTLDGSVSLDTISTTPLVVYGRSSSLVSGPFTTAGDTSRYYPQFTVPIRKVLTAPSGTLTVLQVEHGLTSTDMFCAAVESTSLTDRSYSLATMDSISVSETTYDVSLSYLLYADTSVFVYFLDKQAVATQVYTTTFSHTGTGSETLSISAATHALSNFNIVSQVQQDTGTDRIQVDPESLVVLSTGTVQITLDSPIAATFRIILSAAPAAQTVRSKVPAGSTSTLVVSAPTRPWLFSSLYVPSGSSDLELVLPDSVVYDASADTVTYTVTNGNTDAIVYTLYYEYGNIRANQLCVTDATVVASGSDSRPQLSIWGLDFADLYSTKQDREGWVTHVDSFRRSGEQRLVAGLGGNLFSAQRYSEAASEYRYAQLLPSLQGRVATTTTVGPLFYETGDTPGRTRGYVTGTDSGTGWARATAVSYDGTNGWTKYTVSVPGMQILDVAGTATTIGAVVSVVSGFEDHLTVQDMSYGRHNGTFPIRQITSGTEVLYVWVENASNSADYDDSGTGGEVGSFTDVLSYTGTSPFIPGDTLVSEVFGDVLIPTVLGSSSTSSMVSDIVSLVVVPTGIVVTGARTSSVVPTRDSTGPYADSVADLVEGDMLSYTGISRLLRVVHIHSDIDRTCSIVGNGTSAVVTLGSGDTSFLAVGQEVLLLVAGKYTGIIQISSIPTLSTFTFSSTETTSAAGAILKGSTTTLNEELPYSDSASNTNVLRVESRWIPIEAPADSYSATPSTYVRHFDADQYQSQTFLRSTMVQDNMYFTNGVDEVHKYDGSSVYRAGLPQWQPGLFVTQENTGSRIVSSLRQAPYSSIVATTSKAVITASYENSIPEGTPVRLTGSTQTYTVSSYSTDGTAYHLVLDRAPDATVAASGTISEIGTYRYYYRLNAVDANDNVVISAVTGYQDHVVEVTDDVGIRHKLIGLPVFDNYDYDRLEVQIYRTTKNQQAPFYLVTTLPLDFDTTQGYIEYLDSFADSDINSTGNTDTQANALKPAELGINFSEPMRAKYVTSISNRSVLANVRGYPELDIQIVGDANLGNSTLAGDSLLFRRSNTDSGTTTSMTDRVRYEWINGFTGTVSSPSVGTNTFSFTTSSATGASTGDWIYLTYDTVAYTGRTLTYCGWWQIATCVGTTVTVNLVGAAAAASYPNKYCIATDPTDVPVLLGTDGSMGMFNGDSFDTFDAMRRMSMAVCATQRMVDTTLAGYEQFVPWLLCRGGNDLAPAGRLVVRTPSSSTDTLELVPTFSGYNLFVNAIKRTTGDQVSASTKVFPSRILISYENFPETFDAPTVADPLDSDSVIDINSADGQEITGVIPFFGESAFRFSQQASTLVVFKTNSIYLVDVNNKAQGLITIQRIETEGLGCTAPYSISVTKNGIMFANESGMYCLRKDQTVQYIGRYMERNWGERVSLSSLALAQGHHYGVGRMYKLSVPLVDSVDTSTGYVENSEVYVYNHTREQEEGKLGAWSRYDNHPATGWANLGREAYFASTGGRVFSVRSTGSIEDYRDDSAGVSFSLTTRPNSIGNSGIRKVFDKVAVHYRTGTANVGTALGFSIDTESEYTATTSISLSQELTGTGTDDPVTKDIDTVVHALGRRKGDYVGLQLTNSSVDEALEVAGIDIKVAGLETKGLTQAAQTLK